jgi:adapter protein MecA 1/2
MPLMIEAIPTSDDSIVLIITKVEDPDEIDARFSKFAPAGNSDANKLEGADTLRNLFEKVKEKLGSAEKPKSPQQESPAPKKQSPLRLFSFATMDDVMLAAQFLANMYSGSNTLYKDHEEDMFILAMDRADYTEKDFNRICNMLTEYGSLERSSTLTLAFLEEHCEALVVNDAVQQLALL